METMTTNNDFDPLEDVVAKAHDICNELLLFEAIEMEESEVRLVLEKNSILDPNIQERYLTLVRTYDKSTGKD